jgi:hypothetical protein
MTLLVLVGAFASCLGLTLYFHGRLCGRIRQRYPLHWSALDFKPWLLPDAEREGREIRAQGRMTHYLWKREYRKLGDGRVNLYALLVKGFGICSVLLMAILAWWVLAGIS